MIDISITYANELCFAFMYLSMNSITQKAVDEFW